MLQTEVDSLPRADVDAATATHTRTSRWDIHKITISSAAHRLKVVVACQRHSKVKAGLCHSTRTRHISQLAALRSRTQFQAPPTWARQCQCSRHSNTAVILSTTWLLHKYLTLLLQPIPSILSSPERQGKSLKRTANNRLGRIRSPFIQETLSDCHRESCRVPSSPRTSNRCQRAPSGVPRSVSPCLKSPLFLSFPLVQPRLTCRLRAATLIRF